MAALLKPLKRRIRLLLESHGYAVFDSRNNFAEDGLYTLHGARFLHDPRFLAAYERGVTASRGIDPHMRWRVHVALWAAERAMRARGDFVECGVNAGFVSSAIMRYLDWNNTGRDYYLIDSFAGPVLEQFSPGEVAAGRAAIAGQRMDEGAYVTDFERVRANFAEWPRAIPVKGVIPDALAGLPEGHTAFLHIDLNCALPECAAFEFFWSRLTPGGIVLFDDYNFAGDHLQGDAIDDLAARLGAAVLALPTGQGLVMK